MADFLNTSLSGLQAAQRALATTSNNIANAATEGYSRQRVSFGSRPPEFAGVGYIGTGVAVTDIRRSYDAFLGEEVRTGTAAQARLDTFAGIAGRVGDLIGSDSGGLSQGLQSFFDALQSLANDPASTPVRQTFLSEAGSLASASAPWMASLATLASEVDGRIDDAVTTVNGLAQALADTNGQLAASQGAADGNLPGDLLDQRDRLLQELSGQLDVSVVEADRGTVSVFVGNGQTLVLGEQATTLSSGGGVFGPGQREITIGGSVVSGQLSGGALGGLLDVRREVLEPTRNEVGRVAVGLAEAFNAQHSEGVDLAGNFGADFFAVGGPEVFAASSNTGGATVAATIDSAGALTGDDYQLQFDGTNYTLTNTTRGESVALTGTGTAGDPLAGRRSVAGGQRRSRRRRPLCRAAHAHGRRRLCAAGGRPGRGRRGVPPAHRRLARQCGRWRDLRRRAAGWKDPNLLTRRDHSSSPADHLRDQRRRHDHYPSRRGNDIDLEGYRVQITGAPAAGDKFTVGPNSAGVGDNRNAQALLGLREAGVLEGGQRSLLQQSDALLARVGGATAAAQTALESQTALLRNSEASLESVRGVNLEEEAANLLRFQQAFQANARVIQTANTTFQSLLAAFR